MIATEERRETTATAARIQREQDFHNHSFGTDARQAVEGFYAITDASWARYRELLAAVRPGDRALEYGCGPGSLANLLAEKGTRVTGIDISDVALEQAREKAVADGHDIDFRLMNAEDLEFDPGTFDLICGSAILHHLDLGRAYGAIRRTLKADGRAIFVEPLGHNPAINLYRRLTPEYRTVDEHPLMLRDLSLAHEHFGRVTAHHFHMTSLAAIPFRRVPGFRRLVSCLDAVDRGLFRCLPFTKRWSWFCILEFSEPRPFAGESAE